MPSIQKAKARKHFKERAKQRYGLQFTTSDKKNIVELIQSQKSICIKSLSNSRTIHYCVYMNQDITVIYSNAKKELLTALPKNNKELREYLVLNRKQRRQLRKAVGEKATSTIDLMLTIPDTCSMCQTPFDKTNKEMVTSWFVEVYNSKKKVVLTCPECFNKDDSDG